MKANLDLNASGQLVGIGGAFNMPASGNQVTTVQIQPTGIRVPYQMPARVQVSGAITRTLTPGVKQFCALPQYEVSCSTYWAAILSENPLQPWGDNSFASGGAAVLMAWDADQPYASKPVSPDSGKTYALTGLSGAQLWAGRNGWQCWYFDPGSGLEGPCFTFGGGYTVTVVPDNGDLAGAGQSHLVINSSAQM